MRICVLLLDKLLHVNSMKQSRAKHYFVEIGHEIVYTAILSILLIQVGQLSVSGERMCTKYWLNA